MKSRTDRANLRKTRRIERDLDRLAARNLDEIRYDQIDLVTEHIDQINEVARQIEGFGGLYRKMNSLYGQAIRRRRLLAEVAEAVAL